MQKMKIVLGLAALAGLAIAPSAPAEPLGGGGGAPRHDGGGGGPRHETRTIQLAELPLAAQKTLLERANGAAIQRIVPCPVFYVVNLTLDGKELAVWVNDSGTALEGPGPRKRPGEEFHGTVIAWSDLPPAVQNLVSTKFQGSPLGEIRKSPVTYIAFVKQGTEEAPLRLSEDGQVLPMGHRMRPGEGQAPAHEEIDRRAAQEQEHAFSQGRMRHESQAPAVQEGAVSHRSTPRQEQAPE